MALNYTTRLQNLKNRKFDPQSQRTFVSESFGKAILSENLEYLIESMRAIDADYNRKTIESAQRVQGHLERDLNLHFRRDYRTQGSVMTNSNIKLHSDIDLLNIIGRYHYLAPALLPPSDPYTGDPDADIVALREQSTKILKAKYDIVDDTGTKSISIFNKDLKRKVDIVFCYWYHTEQYEQNNDEYYKGVYLYDFKKHYKELDYPFAHISNVNYKGDQTNDGSRKGTRLLKSLKADSEGRIKLSSFQLTTIVYHIANNLLYYSSLKELDIAKAILNHINYIIGNSTYRKEIKSPTGIEYPLADDSIVPCLVELSNDLGQLISDCEAELNNYFTKRALSIY